MILEAFLLSLNCVVILLILGGAGYVTAARGWYDKSSRVLLARLVTFLSLPAYLFSSVMQTLDHDGLLTLVGSMATPFISIWTCFLLSRIIARVCHVEGVHSGVFSSAFTATNNMFIGLPVSLALFGTEAMVPTLLYFFANTTFFWTVGNYMEAADGRLATMQKPQKVFSAQTFKRIFTPPLLGFLTAIVFILLDFTPPKAIMDAAHYIGIRNIRVTKDMLWVYIGRFVICPLVCLVLTYVIPIPPLFAKVYVIQAALPCITQIAVLAEFHHADVKFATTAVASTTLFSLAVIPAWMILVTMLIPS